MQPYDDIFSMTLGCVQGLGAVVLPCSDFTAAVAAPIVGRVFSSVQQSDSIKRIKQHFSRSMPQSPELSEGCPEMAQILRNLKHQTRKPDNSHRQKTRPDPSSSSRKPKLTSSKAPTPPEANTPNPRLHLGPKDLSLIDTRYTKLQAPRRSVVLASLLMLIVWFTRPPGNGLSTMETHQSQHPKRRHRALSGPGSRVAQGHGGTGVAKIELKARTLTQVTCRKVVSRADAPKPRACLALRAKRSLRNQETKRSPQRPESFKACVANALGHADV